MRTTKGNILKTFLYMAAGLLFCAALFTGCSSDDDDGGGHPGTNKFTYNGKTVDALGGMQFFYGHYEDYGDDANNLEVYIGSEDYLICLDMFIPNGQTKLVEGNYTLTNTCQPYTYIYGGIFEGDDEEPAYQIENASVNVKVSGSTYTIDISGKLTNGKTIIGNYTGALEWSDESGGSGGTQQGSMTIQGTGETFGFYLQTGGYIGPHAASGGHLFLFDFGGDNAFDFALTFLASSATNNLLPNGTYTLGTSIGSFNGAVKPPGYTQQSVTGGTVTVTGSGSERTISFTLQTAGGLNITGSYTGSISKGS